MDPDPDPGEDVDDTVITSPTGTAVAAWLFIRAERLLQYAITRNTWIKTAEANTHPGFSGAATLAIMPLDIIIRHIKR